MPPMDSTQECIEEVRALQAKLDELGVGEHTFLNDVAASWVCGAIEGIAWILGYNETRPSQGIDVIDFKVQIERFSRGDNA